MNYSIIFYIAPMNYKIFLYSIIFYIVYIIVYNNGLHQKS